MVNTHESPLYVFAREYNKNRAGLPPVRDLKPGRKNRARHVMAQIGWDWTRWTEAVKTLAAAGIEDKPWACFDTLLLPGALPLVEAGRVGDLEGLVEAARTRKAPPGPPPPPPHPPDAWEALLGDVARHLPGGARAAWTPVVEEDGSLTVTVPAGDGDLAGSLLTEIYVSGAWTTPIAVREVAG